MDKKKSIPLAVQEILNLYLHLPINGISIQTPYFMNTRKQRAGLRVMVGKGSPEEIIQETQIYAKLKGLDLHSVSESEIRAFMKKVGIGVDCSGFITHVLDTWLKASGKPHLWTYLKFSSNGVLRDIVRRFRPVENISAQLLTNETNTIAVENLNDVQPGDLIRLRNLDSGYHIAIIVSVIRENTIVKEISYAHSTMHYSDQHGVRVGKIEIQDRSKPLHEQKFTDTYEGRDWFYDEIKVDTRYAGIRRLKNVLLS